MADKDTAAERDAKETIRRQERAIWTDVERVGRELRGTEAPKQAMTQVDRDATKNEIVASA
jgi:hypothetical protein